MIGGLLDREIILEIGSDVWIGRGSVLKSGIIIGNGAVGASNSYVISNVPDYAIVGGNPAKVIKYRFPNRIIDELLKIQWWNLSEEEILSFKEWFDSPEEFIKEWINRNIGFE